MRVGLLHFGQSVLLDVSITFLRSAVLAILAMETLSPQILKYRYVQGLESSPTKLGASGLPESKQRRRTSDLLHLILQQRMAEIGISICLVWAANSSSSCYKRKSFSSEVVRRKYADSRKSLDR
jgi:hypothetical protein